MLCGGTGEQERRPAGPHGEIGRVPVYADNLLIARAAFRAAVEQYPKVRIRLRNPALVMAEHRPPDGVTWRLKSPPREN